MNRPLLLLTLVPSIAAILWTMVVRTRAHRQQEARALGFAGMFNILFVLANYLHMCRFVGFDTIILLVQQLTEVCLLPSVFMYMARNYPVRTKRLLWILIPLVLVPRTCIFTAGSHAIFRASDIELFTFNVFYGVNQKHTIYNGDVVMLLQALLVLRFLVRQALHNRRRHTPYFRQNLPYAIWIFVALCFVVFETTLPTGSIFHPILSWVFFGGYSLLMVAIFTILALRTQKGEREAASL